MPNFYFYTNNDIELEAACRAVFDDDCIGIQYGVNECTFIKWTGSKLIGPCDQGLHPYTVRMFNNELELRWNMEIKNGNRRQRAVVVASKQQNLESWTEATEPYEQTLEHQYLLWGEAELDALDPRPGWSYLSTARIGQLPIPAIDQLAAKDRVAITATEYCQQMKFGNVAVVEERLTGIKKIKA